MKRQLLLSGCGLLILFSLGSCTHYYYAPNQHNIPLFKEKNEARVSGALITGDEVSGADIQAAYAMTKESGIIANACIINPNSQVDGKGQLYELGAGYYKPIPGAGYISKKFVFETYGVMGIGSAKNYYGNDLNELHNSTGPVNPNYFVSANFLKAYIQSSIGFTTNFIDIALSEKMGLIHSFGINRHMPDSVYTTLGGGGGRTVVDDVRILNSNKASFLFEPAVTLRMGFKYVKFQFQAGLSIVAGDFRQLTSSPVLNLGINIAIAKRFRQKDDRPKKEKWKQMFD